MIDASGTGQEAPLPLGVLPSEASPPSPLSTEWRGGTCLQHPAELNNTFLHGPSLSTKWRGTEGEASKGWPPRGHDADYAYPINPKSGVPNRPRFGSTTGRSLCATPNHRARVAAYSSTEVVGIQRPSPASLGPLRARVGSWP